MYWDTDVLRHVLLCLFVFNLCYTSKYCDTGIGLSENLKKWPACWMISNLQRLIGRCRSRVTFGAKTKLEKLRYWRGILNLQSSDILFAPKGNIKACIYIRMEAPKLFRPDVR